MAKKRRKKNSGVAGLGKSLSQSFRLLAKSLPLLLILAAGGAIFIGIRSALYADSNLLIQKISVEPASMLSSAQREHLQSQLLGKNILQVNLKKIAAGLGKDPAIQNIKVTRRLPSEIYVEVQKRTPIAFIHFASPNSYGVISEDGMILDVVGPHAATGLIMEAPGLGIAQPAIGQQLKSRGFQEAVQFLQAYPKLALSQKEPVTRLFLDHLGNVSVFLNQGPEIRLGRRPSQRLEGFKKIAPLLESEMRAKIEYIDLQFDDVVVKQKRGGK